MLRRSRRPLLANAFRTRRASWKLPLFLHTKAVGFSRSPEIILWSTRRDFVRWVCRVREVIDEFGGLQLILFKLELDELDLRGVALART